MLKFKYIELFLHLFVPSYGVSQNIRDLIKVLIFGLGLFRCFYGLVGYRWFGLALNLIFLLFEQWILLLGILSDFSRNNFCIFDAEALLLPCAEVGQPIVHIFDNWGSFFLLKQWVIIEEIGSGGAEEKLVGMVEGFVMGNGGIFGHGQITINFYWRVIGSGR
jgi:hypothetical protein